MYQCRLICLLHLEWKLLYYWAWLDLILLCLLPLLLPLLPALPLLPLVPGSPFPPSLTKRLTLLAPTIRPFTSACMLLSSGLKQTSHIPAAGATAACTDSHTSAHLFCGRRWSKSVPDCMAAVEERHMPPSYKGLCCRKKCIWFTCAIFRHGGMPCRETSRN